MTMNGVAHAIPILTLQISLDNVQQCVYIYSCKEEIMNGDDKVRKLRAEAAKLVATAEDLERGGWPGVASDACWYHADSLAREADLIEAEERCARIDERMAALRRPW